VAASEVKALEKTFKLLGLDPQSVYAKVHAAATEPITVRRPSAASAGHTIPAPLKRETPVSFQLDSARVAALQADSERVAALLGAIFNQPAPEPEAVAVATDTDDAEPQAPRLLGLDADDSDLLHTLLTRLHWSQDELEELAADRGMMLSGALERINDASFEKFDRPLLEGEDPVELNPEVVREFVQ
jgi:hypothetical protein